MEGMRRARHGVVGRGAPVSSLGTPPSQHLHVLTNLEAFWSFSSKSLTWNLHYKGMIDETISHWWLNSTSSPASLCRGQVGMQVGAGSGWLSNHDLIGLTGD